jgi:transcription-repair coupling factor (superfamily II helicase)
MNNHLNDILKIVRSDSNFKNLLNEIKTGDDVIISGLDGSFLSLTLKSISDSLKKKIVLISNDLDQLNDYYHDLKLLSGTDSKITLIKEPPSTLRNRIQNKENTLDWLVEGLISFNQQEGGILLCEQNIFEYKIPNTEKVMGHLRKISKNENIEYDNFIKELILNGFERMDFVSGQGQIAVRGGIIDLYPIAWDNPLRIEFWGNDIDSIREFEVISQRSIREFDSVEFLDSMFTIDDFEADYKTITNYFDAGTFTFIDDSIDLELLNTNLEEHSLKIIKLSKLSNSKTFLKSNRQLKFTGSIKSFITEINRLAVNGYKMYLSTEGAIHLERFKSMLTNALDEHKDTLENNINFVSSESLLDMISWSDESLSRGFNSETLKVAYFTEHEIFDRLRINDGTKKKKTKGLTVKELQELKIGDFVTHEDKGIGIFDGFQTISINDSKQDCARIKFADGDMLYVHLNYIGKLSKYSAQEGAAPILSKLGSADWLRRKERTKKRLKDIARDLIKLYAERKAQKGFAFPADTVWQKEFEASFIYEDTPDQATTTQDIKLDMESSSPMDRLVCGDVGFGKTEVAIRAAFKAAQSGKQSAILVPTTILAQQHYMSFKDRLGKYPVNVDVISRFRTKKEQTQTIENIKSGKIDILIGTHRLLSKDIIFKNLGLLVVDEEHRFGVGHKEKLRQLKANVDTLTLTATPIPRTLNFSLMGARDLSLIETPPRNRTPVITEILEWDNKAIVQAINTEIERGGQVFFVSDKIEDIERIAADVKKLMPQLTFAVAHGQMKTSELEDIMEKFIEGKYDVLVATKIIESGIDIPNANTILINRAQNFGLAELYQLRGRVGRSNHQAYCYLLIPPAHKLPQKSLQRLQAIEEFTELGSGFKLSMRDLEIRGAGNLLGAEQSGFIIDIGFELYQKVLDEAVNELKYTEFADIFGDEEQEEKAKYLNEEIAIELDEDALFPANYIAGDTDRFIYYKKLYTLNNNQQLEDIIREIVDKYGKMPKEAENLIFVVRLRIASLATGFTRITIKKNKMICEFPPQDFKDYYSRAFEHIVEYLSQTDNFSLKQVHEKLFMEFKMDNRSQALEIIWKIKKIIELNLE